MEKVNDVAYRLSTADQFSLREALDGAGDWHEGLNDDADSVAQELKRRSGTNTYAVKSGAEGEAWLRDFITKNEGEHNSSAYRYSAPAESLVERLAKDWPGLRATYKEVFGSVLRAKEDFYLITRDDYRKMLDYLLDNQGKKLTDFDEGMLRIGHHTAHNFLSEKHLQNWLKRLVVTGTDKNQQAWAKHEGVKALVLQDDSYRRNDSNVVYVKPLANKTWDVLATKYGEKIVAHENEATVEALQGILDEYTNGHMKFSYIHDNKEALQNEIEFKSSLKAKPLAEDKVYSGVRDYSSVAALKRRARDLSIPGRSAMSDDELVEAITAAALAAKPLEEITPGKGCGVFLRRHREDPYHGRRQRSDLAAGASAVDDDAAALETIAVQSVKVRAKNNVSGGRSARGDEGTFDAFAHSSVPAIPSRIPRGKPGGYYSSGDAPESLVSVSYPDVFANAAKSQPQPQPRGDKK